MYATQIQKVKLNHTEFEILYKLTQIANNMANVTLYSIRQHFFHTGQYLTYNSNYHLCKNNENYKLLNSNIAQQIMKSVHNDFSSFFALLKLKQQGKYNEKVSIPHYKEKGGNFLLKIAQIQIDEDGYFLLPMSVAFRQQYGNLKIKVPSNLDYNIIKEVKIIPICHSKRFEVHWVYEIQNETQQPLLEDKCLSIDLGVNNLMTCATNDGNCFIIDGKKLKSINQYVNKENAKIQNCNALHKVSNSKRLDNLWQWRNKYVNNYIHVACRKVINYCLEYQIGTLILGYNDTIQKESNMGNINNQNFVNIPIGKIKHILEFLCMRYGIKFIEQEESYTSKASFLDDDYIPTYGEDDDNTHFTGKRIHRGMYKSKSGVFINADLNATLNIMKKAIQTQSLNCSIVMSKIFNNGKCITPQRVRLHHV